MREVGGRERGRREGEAGRGRERGMREGGGGREGGGRERGRRLCTLTPDTFNTPTGLFLQAM